MQCSWITLKPSPPPFVEKLSSTNLVPGAKKAGDHWSSGPRHGSNIGWKFSYSYVIREQAEKKKKEIAPTSQRPYCFMGRQKLGLPLTLPEVSSATALLPLRLKWKSHLSLRPLSFLLMPLMWTQTHNASTMLAESCFQASLQSTGSIILWPSAVFWVVIMANTYWVLTLCWELGQESNARSSHQS